MNAVSLWDEYSPARAATRQLVGNATTEITVIGAGMTGLSAALYFARHGHRVIVLEAKSVGWGGSGRNNGQVIPTLSAAEPDWIEQRFGDTGIRFVELIRDSADVLFQLVRDEKIDCEAEQSGWFQPAHSPAHVRISEQRVAAWSQRGAPCELLDRAQTGALLGSDQWYGGMRNPTGGHINPLMFVRGLADVCERAGVRIFENSIVTSVDHLGPCRCVHTTNGQVKSDQVLLATNAYTDALTDSLAPEMARSVVPVTSWQMATEPLHREQRLAIVPGREAVSDTRGDLRFFRLDARGRLVAGGALMFKTKAHQRLPGHIGARLASAFPILGKPEFTHIWSGYVGMTRDRFPRFHKLGPGYWGVSGYNGRGVALSVSIGREMARAMLADNDQDPVLPFTVPKPLAFHFIARKLAPMALAYFRWLDRRAPKITKRKNR